MRRVLDALANSERVVAVANANECKAVQTNIYMIASRCKSMQNYANLCKSKQFIANQWKSMRSNPNLQVTANCIAGYPDARHTFAHIDASRVDAWVRKRYMTFNIWFGGSM